MAAAAANDPSETYRQNQTTNAKRINAATIASAHSAPNLPAAVATPLPPRNLNQTGKQCPSNAKNPAMTMAPASPWITRPASDTASHPLPASNAKVSTPGNGPATRTTFVAPIFPLPVLRTSAPPKSLASISPNGIDPSRYETRNSRIGVIGTITVLCFRLLPARIGMNTAYCNSLLHFFDCF